MTSYEVEFQEIKKYNPMTRTVTIKIPNDRTSPERVFRSEFGTKKQVKIIKIKKVN